MSLLSPIETAVAPYLVWVKLAAAAVAVVGLLGAGFYSGYRWELGAYNGLVAADAKAMTVAVADAAKTQHTLDLSGAAAGEAEAYFRGKLDGTVINLKLGAPANVTIAQDTEAAAASHAGCITYGFERMLVAGERGVSPEDLALPAGVSVDDCTADEPSDLAARAAQDLAAGFGNGQQLDALEAELKNQQLILETK